MAITIDGELEALVGELAEQAGVSPLQAVRAAVEADLERLRRQRKAQGDTTPGGLTREMVDQLFGY